ncbi:MAG: hypothetical protein LJE70_11350 [Chromatiaceae bacterium]|nr:hypothetical protein [Chromatiaceae bacterium]
MKNSVAQLANSLPGGSRAIRLAIVMLGLLHLNQPAQGHEGTPAWLDAATLERGLYVELRHPRVVRTARPFQVSVVMGNLQADGDVTVEEVRYLLPGARSRVIHRRDAVLANRGAAYNRYKAATERLQRLAADRDFTGAGELYAESRSALRDIAAGTLRDHQRIDAHLVPPVGASLDVTVVVQIFQGGQRQRIQRAAQIPVQPPLPNGGDNAWFAGDQHLHTAFSIDAFFLDGTRDLITDYAAAAQAIGLDWIIVTDHTNVDFLSWYDPSLYSLGELLAGYYRTSKGFLVLQGQEMGVGSIGALGEPAHLLAYPLTSDSTGFLPNPCSGLFFNHVNCEPEQDVVDRVNDAGGIGFIAHPFESRDLAFAPWDVDADIWGWGGLEIFNSNRGLFGEDDQYSLDWWYELLREIAPPKNGQLADRTSFPTRFPVGLGNSDAHRPGDIGSTFTYAWLPESERGSAILPREKLMASIVGGRVVASNGPLVYGTINGAGTGDVAVLSEEANQLSVTLETTAEFGPVGDYEVTVLVNGLPRHIEAPSGSPEYAMTIVLDDLLTPPDKFVTIHAERTVCDGCPQDTVTPLAIANPIWLEFVTP